MKTVRISAAAALAAVLFGAGGCVSLLPQSKPAQLYRFEYRPATAADGSAASRASACDRAATVGVILPPANLPRAAQGDQILTVTGDQAAYIAESRWVSPAASLFQDALEAALQEGCGLRTVRRSDFGAGAATLRVDVDRFETDYAAPGSAPVVAVLFKATLLKRGGDFSAERVFKATDRAADNRVGAIVEAYSRATSATLRDLTTWVAAKAPAVAAQETAASTGGGGRGPR